MKKDRSGTGLSKHEIPVTLLVNSSDGFNDCWEPYFKLLESYWPQMDWPILLNTEYRDFSWPGLDVNASKVAVSELQRLSWSDCLMRAIDKIETPLLLYMQEDYFLDAPVDDRRVRQAVQLMLENPHIAHIGLTKHGSHGPFELSPYEGFGLIGRKAKYRISTQAGLWRPAALKSYLRPNENGWMFEIYGTWRAHRDKALFLTALFEEKFAQAPINYTHTGIIKGQWHPAMYGHFMQHQLSVNFAERGFYNEPPKLLRKWEVIKKLSENPFYFAAQLLQKMV